MVRKKRDDLFANYLIAEITEFLLSRPAAERRAFSEFIKRPRKYPYAEALFPYLPRPGQMTISSRDHALGTMIEKLLCDVPGLKPTRNAARVGKKFKRSAAAFLSEELKSKGFDVSEHTVNKAWQNFQNFRQQLNGGGSKERPPSKSVRNA